jgi:hypothetical protein
VVLDRRDTLEALRNLLVAPRLSPRATIIGHNIAYDASVSSEADPSLLPLWFRAYSEGRVSDTGLRQKLLDLAAGHLGIDPVSGRRINYSLADLVRLYFDVDLSDSKKNPDAWRLRYHELDGIPLEQWPEEAIAYARDDARWTLAVYLEQQKLAPAPEGNQRLEKLARAGDPAAMQELERLARRTGQRPGLGVLANEPYQARADFSLRLASCWGLRTDRAALDSLEASLREEIGEVDILLKSVGLMRANGTMDQAALREGVNLAYRGFAPTTDKGAVKTDTETLLASGDPVLEALGKAKKPKHHLRSTLKHLRAGQTHPINPRFWVIQETGRTSSSGPNIQNLKRKGGYRESFAPRPGYVFVGADYSQIEMCTLAHVCLTLFGWSAMADAIRAGRDLHIVLAGELLGWSYAEAVELYKAKDPDLKRAREFAKVGNYGFAGGMGPSTFVEYAAGFDIETTEDEARTLRETWLRTWPEMREYFAHINSLFEPGSDKCTVEQLHSGRIRAGCFYCEACNSYFQGLAADGALDACFAVSRECYAIEESPLYGSRMVAFVHDEILLESPAERAHDAAQRLAQVMVGVMRQWVPDVPIEAEPVVMSRWSKSAVPTFDDQSGRLIPWSP